MRLSLTPRARAPRAPGRRPQVVAAVTTLAVLATGLAGAAAAQAATPVAAAATTTCADPWSPTPAYGGGATVSYDGQNYRAKWWTQNNVPGAEQYGPWASLGAC